MLYSDLMLEDHELCIEEMEDEITDIIGEELPNCLEGCYSSYESGLGIEDFSKDEEKADECKDKTCINELLECMGNCEEKECSRNGCLGEEGEKIVEEAGDNDKSCREFANELEYLAEDEDNYYKAADTDLLDDIVGCAEYLLGKFEDAQNNKAEEYFKCNVKCARDAITKNSSAQLIMSFAALLAILVVFA